MSEQEYVVNGFDVYAASRRLGIWPQALERLPSSKLFQDGLCKLAEEAMQAVPDPGWRPIETAKKIHAHPILLYGRYWADEQGWMQTPLVGCWWYDRWEVGWRCNFGIRPTHWMPLPTAPHHRHTLKLPKPDVK